MPQRKSDANDPPVDATLESLARKADLTAAGVAGESARGARAQPPADDVVEGTGEEHLMDDG